MRHFLAIAAVTISLAAGAYLPPVEERCGVKVEMIEDPLMKKIRQLDKLVDELAKGKPMEKIKR